MTDNAFRRLQALLPPPPLLVALVTAHHDDDTSTVRLPAAAGDALVERGANIYTGALLRVRGRTVPVGKRAFVRAGVIETQAPDADIVEILIGETVAPPASGNIAPPRPAPVPTVIACNVGSGAGTGTTAGIVESGPPPPPPATSSGVDVVTLRTATADLQYRGSYGANAVGIGGEYAFWPPAPPGGSLSADERTVTFPDVTAASYYDEMLVGYDYGEGPFGRRAALEFVIVQQEGKYDLACRFQDYDGSGMDFRLHASGRLQQIAPSGTASANTPLWAQGDVIGFVLDSTAFACVARWYINGALVGTKNLGTRPAFGALASCERINPEQVG